MTSFPILYSRASTGAIQRWQIFVSGDSFWTEAGQVGGQLTKSAPTVCQGKNVGRANETTPEQQALAEAQAKHQKKLDDKNFPNIDDIDKETFFSPQLAKVWDDYKDDIDLSGGGWCASPKLDGVRVIERKEGAFSRNGKPFVSFPHINELLRPLFRRYPDLILDGEIYTHSYKDNFNKIISLAKKSKPSAAEIAESAESLEYWMFDCGSMDTPFNERLRFLQWVVEEVGDPRIKLVRHDIVRSEGEVEKHLQSFLTDGFEGAMLKNLNAYYQNKRTADCLKYKLFQTEEFKLLDIIEGDGARSGMFGRATLRTEAGHTFDSNARGNEEFYRDLLKNKHQYINKLTTVRFQNWTPGDQPVPRFPVITAIRNYE